MRDDRRLLLKADIRVLVVLVWAVRVVECAHCAPATIAQYEEHDPILDGVLARTLNHELNIRSQEAASSPILSGHVGAPSRRLRGERSAAAMRPKGRLHECRLVRARRVVRVALGCLDVPMPHPLLQGPHGNTRAGHRCAERVAQIVEAMLLLKPRGLECSAEAPQDRRLVERPGRVGIGEHENVATALPRRVAAPVKLTRALVCHRNAARRTTGLWSAELA